MAINLTITNGTVVSAEALESYALTTLNSAKRFIGLSLSESTYDTLLNQLINRVTDMLEKRCDGRRFYTTTYTNERYDGNGRAKLFLRNYPIVSVGALTMDNEAVSEATDYDDYDGYWIEPCIKSIKLIGCLYRVDKWDKGWQNIKITYTAGYATIPNDLKLACEIAVREFYNLRKNEDGKKSETIGNYSYSFEDMPDKTQKEIMNILNY